MADSDPIELMRQTWESPEAELDEATNGQAAELSAAEMQEASEALPALNEVIEFFLRKMNAAGNPGTHPYKIHVPATRLAELAGIEGLRLAEEYGDYGDTPYVEAEVYGWPIGEYPGGLMDEPDGNTNRVILLIDGTIGSERRAAAEAGYISGLSPNGGPIPYNEATPEDYRRPQAGKLEKKVEKKVDSKEGEEATIEDTIAIVNFDKLGTKSYLTKEFVEKTAENMGRLLRENGVRQAN